MSGFLKIGELIYPFLNRKLMILLLIGIVPFLFVYDFVLYKTVFYYFDFETQWIPTHSFVYKALTEGQSILWNPFIMLGYPQHAEQQIGAFYPLNMILHWLPNQAYAISLSVYLHLIIGFASTYLLARSFKLETLASIHAAICFTFSGFIFAQLTNYPITMVAVYLPLKLLLITCYFTHNNAKYLFYFTLVLSAELLISHTNTSFITNVAAGLYFVLLAVDKKESLLRNLGIFALYSFIAIALAAVQLFPTYELMTQSVRSGGISYEMVTSYSHSFSQYLTAFFPMMFGNRNFAYTGSENFEELFTYIGIIGIILGLLGAMVLVKRRDNRLIAIAGIVGLLGFIISLGSNNPFVDLHHLLAKIPGFNYFRVPARWSLVPTLGLAILSGYGLQVFIGWLKERRYLRTLLTTLTITLCTPMLVYALGWKDVDADRPALLEKILKPLQGDLSGMGSIDQLMYTLFTHISPLTYYLLIGSAFVIVTGLVAWKLPVKYSGPSIVAIGLLDALFVIKPVNIRAPSDYYSAHPEHIAYLQENAGLYRTITAQDVPNVMSTDNSMGAFYGIQSIRGHIALPLLNLTLLSFHFDDPDIQDFVGVRYVINPSDSGYEISERRGFFPRAFLLEKHITSENEEGALNAFLELSNEDRKLYAAITRDSARLLNVPENTGLTETNEKAGIKAVDIISYENARVEMRGETRRPAFLILTDMYYPGWQAKLNGQEKPIIPINGAFRGVYIDQPGTFSLEMVYRPLSFAIGALISFLALLGVIANWYWLIGRKIDWKKFRKSVFPDPGRIISSPIDQP